MHLHFSPGTTTVGEMLARIRTESRDETEKGRWFENLAMRVLRAEPEYDVDEIHRWTDWPQREELTGLDGRDLGIDLVARLHDGNWVAVQCKCYGEGYRVGKPQIDSFLAASARNPFTLRWIVATTSWTRNAESEAKAIEPPLRRIDFLRHERDPIPTSRIERPVQQPWPLQREAIEDVVHGLHNHDRGRLVMACGTGKTFTSLCIAERVVPDGGRILFLAPSIALVSQARREWLRQTVRPLECRVVCSDRSAGGRGETEDVSLSGLECLVTSDPGEIATVLSEDVPTTRVVFCTYQSVRHVTLAQGDKGAPAFDLALMDEAHCTTGLDDIRSNTGFRIVHHNDRLQAAKRLYMTATPRIYTLKSRRRLRDKGLKSVDMSDEDVYGPEMHRLPFSVAVNAGILSDYRVVVLGVHTTDATPGLRDRLIQIGESKDSSKPMVVSEKDIARVLGTSLAVHGLSEGDQAERPGRLLKTIAFANSIAKSQFFASALAIKEVRGYTTRRLRGSDSVAARARIMAQHLDGTDSALTRSKALRILGSAEVGGPVHVLCNVKLFGEGVDVPSLDAIVFAEPRESQVDIVQAVGRVMRRAEGKRFGYIVVPAVIDPGEDALSALAQGRDGYSALGRVLRALQSHDGRLAEDPLRFVKVYGTKKLGGGGSEKAPSAKQTVQELLDFEEVTDGLYAQVVAASGLGEPGLQVSQEIEYTVRQAARAFEQGDLAGTLAQALGLPSGEGVNAMSACTIAALLAVNACLMHRRLSTSEAIEGLPGLGRVGGAKDPRAALSAAWKNILDRGYVPVFAPALAVLDALPGRQFAFRALRLMAECANEVADSLSDLGYDHAGPLYHRILPTAKSDGAFYTHNLSALMLARLALSEGFADWTNAEAVSALRVIDPACGTGTLLMAALRTVKERVQAAHGGDEVAPEYLHQSLVEDSLCGLDINRHGIQMAACNLTLGAPTVDYRRMNLMTLKHGPQPDGSVRTGSLELLGTASNDNSLQSLVRPLATMAGLEAEQVSDEGGAEFPLEDVDLVIMNPPFTDNMKRSRQFGPNAVRHMQQRELWLRDYLRRSDPSAADVIDSNSIRTFFTPLAERLLDGRRGVLAQVLAVTACTAASGEPERKFLSSRFHVERVVVSHDPKRINFSENTGIHDCLLVARRRPKNPPPPDSFCIHASHADHTRGGY